MNEQLVVKNFGPIKDATVDFKRVTVFIGPTGGGKSTLAKLAAIFRDENQYKVQSSTDLESSAAYKSFSIQNFFSDNSLLEFTSKSAAVKFENRKHEIMLIDELNAEKIDSTLNEVKFLITSLEGLRIRLQEKNESKVITQLSKDYEALLAKAESLAVHSANTFASSMAPSKSNYVPAERVFIPALEYSWAGLMRDDIGLPKILLEFANSFSLSRKEVLELDIPFLNVKYLHIDGRDFIKIPEREEPLMLLETASGIQSVTPLLVLLEHLSRNTEQAQSFIIEEPELNLFPTAQFELVKILVDKCARLDGQNDLVLTTHSPYVLTALNLLCYAFRIAQQDEATAKKVAKLIPRHCWIDPDQFAAYYVDSPGTKRKQQVRSIINKKTGLIEENELDTASEALSDIFDKLVRLHKPTTARAK